MKEIAAHNIVEILRRVNLFSTLDEATLNMVSDKVTQAVFEPNEAILSKGDIGEYLYIITGGKAKVHDDMHTIAILGEGEIVGELSLIDPAPRSASVTAIDLCECLKLGSTEFFEIFKQNSTFSKAIIHQLAQRLRKQNEVTIQNLTLREKQLVTLVEERTAELKQKNIELARQRELFRLIADNTSDVISVYDPTLKLVFANELAFERIYEEKIETNSEFNLTSPIHKNDLETFDNLFAKSVADRTTQFNIRYRIKVKGKVKWLDNAITLLFTKKDVLQSVIVISREITDRIQTELALEQSEMRHRLISEYSQDIISIIAEGGTIAYISPACYQHLGYTPDEMVGKNIFDFVCSEFKSMAENWINTFLRDQIPQPAALQFKVKTLSGQSIWVETIAKKMQVENSPQYRTLTVTRNISARKQVEEHLVEAQQNAANLMRNKSFFLASVNHQIRTPLSVIISGIGVLKLEDDITELKRDLSSIEFSAKSLLAILNDILDINRLDLGENMLEPIETDLYDLFKNLQKAIKSKASENGAKFNMLLDINLPQFVVTDPVRLSHVLTNLINFAQRQAARTEITLEISALGFVGTNSSKAQFRIVIPDKDFSQNELKQIMNTVTLASLNSEFIPNSVGISLAITKKLIENFGSTLHINHIPSQGIELVFDLLLTHCNAPTMVLTSNETKPIKEILHGLKIILVEDNEINLMITNKVLLHYGANVRLCRTIAETKKTIDTDNFDVMLLDIELPDGHGSQIVDYIRQLPQPISNLPMIALTASGYTQEEFNQSKFDAVIQKPFENENLIASIKRLVDQKKSSTDFTEIIALGNGDQNFIKQLIDQYLINFEQLLTALNQFNIDSDFTETSNLIHKNLSAVKMLKLNNLNNNLRLIETELKQQIMPTPSVLKNIKAELWSTIDALHKFNAVIN